MRTMGFLQRIALAAAVIAAAPAAAQQVPEMAGSQSQSQQSPPSLPAEGGAAQLREALKARLAELGEGTSDEERAEHAALGAFYTAREEVPLWLTPAEGQTAQAAAVVAELARAGEWGLNARDFALPHAASMPGSATTAAPTPQDAATFELDLSLAVLKYGRYARGGRIIFPAEQLSSYLDRRPQLLAPGAILQGIAGAEHPDAYLRGLNPQHPQFERLRQKYLALIRQGAGGETHGALGSEAKRLLANMEEWRWMPADMGALYVWNNIPEYLQRVVKNGEVIATERIVAGEIGKQTPVFSRPMRRITFKPTWKVPDSIKVRELWPSLLKGGRLMREWGLELRTKDDQFVDWTKLNWAKTDIREYDVIQPNGPKSVMGKVKFSFPNQHTVFMHDTMPRDRYMFNVAQRTFSHGCMRVHNPMRLATVVLAEEGWDEARVAAAFNDGPLNNEINLEHRIPVHNTYFTAIVDDTGKLHTFPDVYGHERRITLALEGKWDAIVRGRDHLAPVELDLAAAQREVVETPEGRHHTSLKSNGKELFDSIFGTF
jgi:L,D-transpeptidase YcbB